MEIREEADDGLPKCEFAKSLRYIIACQAYSTGAFGFRATNCPAPLLPSLVSPSTTLLPRWSMICCRRWLRCAYSASLIFSWAVVRGPRSDCLDCEGLLRGRHDDPAFASVTVESGEKQRKLEIETGQDGFAREGAVFADDFTLDLAFCVKPADFDAFVIGDDNPDQLGTVLSR